MCAKLEKNHAIQNRAHFEIGGMLVNFSFHPDDLFRKMEQIMDLVLKSYTYDIEGSHEYFRFGVLGWKYARIVRKMNKVFRFFELTVSKTT